MRAIHLVITRTEHLEVIAYFLLQQLKYLSHKDLTAIIIIRVAQRQGPELDNLTAQHFYKLQVAIELMIKYEIEKLLLLIPLFVNINKGEKPQADQNNVYCYLRYTLAPQANLFCLLVQSSTNLQACIYAFQGFQAFLC